MVDRATKVYFDGGCRPNPGTMETAVVIRGVLHHHADIGSGTSAEAEWRALIAALEVARSAGERDVVLIGDAADVIAQANGKGRSRGARGHVEALRALAAGFDRVRIRHVRRSHNLAGIALDRRRRGH